MPLLAAVLDGNSIQSTTKKLSIKPQTADDIHGQATGIQIFNDEHDLPPPTLHEQIAIKLKPSRPSTLTEIDKNRIFKA
jgi:hypothetical protein